MKLKKRGHDARAFYFVFLSVHPVLLSAVISGKGFWLPLRRAVFQVCFSCVPLRISAPLR